jgi:hypothetical protein
MGRYYSGSIEGKFWFGLQSSDAPSRFGGEELEPSYIEYHFNEDHLEEVEEEIQAIEESLGDKKKIIEDFLETKGGYSSDDLTKLGITEREMRDFADLGLGIQIRDCILESGYCDIQAEL